jgi:hypothetical protein
MYRLSIFILLFAFSCMPKYQKNSSFDISIIKIDETEGQVNQNQLIDVLTQLKSALPRAIILKPLLKNPTDSLISKLNHLTIPIYASCRVDPESGDRSFKEDEYFVRTPYLLKRSFRKVIFPADTLLPLFTGLGVEAAAFRNSGQLESYHVIIGINGKSFASLPLKLVGDLRDRKMETLKPHELYITKSGTLPIKFSDPNSMYTEYSSSSLDTEKIKNHIVVIYSDTEDINTMYGSKNKAEITADVVNQLLNQIQPSNE